MTPTRSIDSIADLALTYTPGVARVSSAIAAEPELARRFTWAPRVVAVVSDGSAVLGLGDIGPVASLPVSRCSQPRTGKGSCTSRPRRCRVAAKTCSRFAFAATA